MCHASASQTAAAVPSAWAGCKELPGSLSASQQVRECVQGCSMASPDTRAGLLLVGCSQDQFLRVRLEPCRNLCDCRMAATRGEGGQMHLKILDFLIQGHLKRLGICQCWMICSRAVTSGHQEGDGVRGFTRKRGGLRYRPF